MTDIQLPQSKFYTLLRNTGMGIITASALGLGAEVLTDNFSTNYAYKALFATALGAATTVLSMRLQLHADIVNYMKFDFNRTLVGDWSGPHYYQNHPEELEGLCKDGQEWQLPYLKALL